MTQVLPNYSERITNYVDQYSKVKIMINSLVITDIMVNFWGYCKALLVINFARFGNT